MDGSPTEYQPCPLQFYDFRQLDHRLQCPIYSSILEHPDDGIALRDLDNLQSELLALQANVHNRIHLLESELTVLNEWQVKRDYRKRKHSDTSDSGHPRGRRLSDSQPIKKQRLEELRRSKYHKTQEALGAEEEHSTVPKLKGDTPDRFWASVEPYFADISEAELRMLQEFEDESEFYHVPPLGQHYSQRWAVEEVGEEKGEGGRLTQLVDPTNARIGEGWQDEADSLLKQAESLPGGGEERVRYGPLTQRLIGAFLEVPSPGQGIVSRPSGRRFSPPLNLPQVQALETRIREELTTLGLLEPQELKGDSEGEDEILLELQRKQAELRVVMEYNRQQRETLLGLARAEMKREETRSQLREVDGEVMELLRKFSGYKQKKKGINRKEREAAWRTLELRDSLCQKLLQPS